MKIYTGFGDTGKTRLYGGQVVDKDDLRVKAYGTMDELNSMVGLLITYIDDKGLIGFLQGIQYNLFDLSAELASLSDEKTKSATSTISEESVKEVESKIDDINSQQKSEKSLKSNCDTLMNLDFLVFFSNPDYHGLYLGKLDGSEPKKFVGDNPIKKIIVVKNKLVNIVV